MKTIKVQINIMWLMVGTILSAGFISAQINNNVKNETFTVAYSKKLFSGVDLNDVQVAINLTSIEIGSMANKEMNTNFKVESFIFDEGYLEANITNFPDLINLTAIELLQSKNYDSFEPLFCSTQIREHPGEPLVILVHESSAYSTIGDLKKSNITFPQNELTGFITLWLDNLLLQNGFNVHAHFFETYKYSSKPGRAISDVFFHKMDVCVVGLYLFTTMKELNPQLGKQLRVLLKSEPFVNTLCCVNRNHPAEFKTRLFNAALDLPSKPSGQQLLKLFGGKSFAAYKPEYLKSTLNLLRTNEKLLSNYHPNNIQ